MPDIWEQFHALPKAIRDSVATPQALAALDDLERQHPGLDLAGFVMRVMVHEIPVGQLPDKLAAEAKVDQMAAAAIVHRLEQEVLVGAGEYLGLKSVVVSTPIRPVVAPIPPPSPPTPVLPPTPSAPPATPSPLPPPPAPWQRPPAPPPTTSGEPTKPVGPTAPTQAYSDDDAQEIAQQAARLKNLAGPSLVQDLDQVAGEIMRQHNLGYSDELLRRRALAIIKARLKSIRSTAQTVEVLARDPKIGGLGMDRDMASLVATAAEAQAGQLMARGMTRPPEPPLTPPPPAIPKVAQEHPAPMPPLRRQAPPSNLPLPELPNVTDAPRPSRPIIRPVDIPAPPAAPALTARPRPPAPAPITPIARQTDRPTTSDIRRPVNTLGPAEEMRSLTLADFRRLGQGAAESTRKMEDKYKHWQHESYALWADAVAGWRQSDVYQLYLAMGRESLERGVPISQIVLDRGRAGQPYLSEHEFVTISDFNRQLQV